MKKYLSILIISAISLIINNSSANSCPDWAEYEDIYEFTVGNCDYEAKICWKCPITTGQLWIAVSYVKKKNRECENGMNLNQVKAAIYEQINTPGWLLGLCTGSIPPCDDKLYYTLIDYNCWYKYNDNGDIKYYICDWSTWCAQDWWCCWDQMQGFITEPVSQDWYQVGGDPSCSGIEPGNPPIGQSSSCWPASVCN